MTRQDAINAKCKDCIYDSCSPGTWRRQVTDCTQTDCSLWEYRPVDAVEKAKRRADEIAAMSPAEHSRYLKEKARILKLFKNPGISNTKEMK